MNATSRSSGPGGRARPAALGLAKLAPLIAPLIAALTAGPTQAQVIVRDRQLQGRVGFTNTVLSPPQVGTGTMEARSIGLPAALDSTGPVFGGTPPEREYSVIVNAYEDGQYWLTTVVSLGASGRYHFGYAANDFAAPGWPTFTNEVFDPTTVDVPLSAPAVIDRDVLECAGRFRIRFIEEDGFGGWRPAAPGRWWPTPTPVTAAPRHDPADGTAPFHFRGGGMGAPSRPAVQAETRIANSSSVAELWVRASEQVDGPDILYSVRVEWKLACERHPDCSDVLAASSRVAYFEGATGSFGSLGTGGVPSPNGTNPGIRIGCDESIDLFVVVPPPCAPEPCPGPTGPGGSGGGGGTGVMAGCLNLIGEPEKITRVSSVYSGDPPISNAGESPFPYSDLFDAFDPSLAEGIYRIRARSVAAVSGIDAWLTLGQPFVASYQQPLVRLHPPTALSLPPPAGATITGPDLCMAPGILTGEVRLRDGVARSSGALRALYPTGSRLYATTADADGVPWNADFNASGAGKADHDFYRGSYDPSGGVWRIPYETPIGNPNNSSRGWSQRRLSTWMYAPGLDPEDSVEGGSRVIFDAPSYDITWAPADFISTDLGGAWPPELGLEPGTRIAPRPARMIPFDYDLCFGTLRVQIDTENFELFDPRILSIEGRHSSDGGTPADPSDDVSYEVRRSGHWQGAPESVSRRARRGWINMVLPEGTYDNIGGRYQTYFGPVIPPGTTPLPPFDAVLLRCGQSCTVTENAISCLESMEACNDPSILATGATTLRGTLRHAAGIVRGFTRVGAGPEIDFDFVAAGVTCGAGCEDEFEVTVSGFSACRNRAEIVFIDEEGRGISAFVVTTLDQEPPTFFVSQAPDAAPFACGDVIPVRTWGCLGDPYYLPLSSLPVARDNCSMWGTVSPLTVTYDAPQFGVVGETTTIRVTAVDACGNVATCDVRFVGLPDETPPTFIDLPPDREVECGDPIPEWPTVRATDNWVSMTVTTTDTMEPGDCPDDRVLTRTWTSVDRCGNVATATRRIAIVDSTPPAFSGAPADAEADCSAVPPPALLTATDACDPDPVITFDETRTDGTCLGNYVLHRRWLVTDRCGNVASHSQDVTVTDTTPPVIVATSADIACTWPPNHWYACFSTASFSPTITDDCSEPITWRFAGCSSDQCDEAPCDEHPDENGDGHFTDDCVVSADGETLCLRSERAGAGPNAQAGRRYAISAVATDACGNESAPVIIGSVHVAHDQSEHEGPCVDVTKKGRRELEPGSW